jgi:hypothetical protein
MPRSSTDVELPNEAGPLEPALLDLEIRMLLTEIEKEKTPNKLLVLAEQLQGALAAKRQRSSPN